MSLQARKPRLAIQRKTDAQVLPMKYCRGLTIA